MPASAMKVCFITDGGGQLGLGHVQQSTTFAKLLEARADVCFLTKSDDAVLTAIREAGFDASHLGSDPEILDRLVALDPDVVVFDKIDVAEDLARTIDRTLRASLVLFTNLTEANKHADITVTADIGSRFSNVSYTDTETNTLHYYGPKYWVLRPEFHQYKCRRKTRPSATRQILLMFGGSDPANLTSVVLEALLAIDKAFGIDVILGASFSHDDCVRHVLDGNGRSRSTVTIRRNVKNVAELMYHADVVIASPGLSVFEALCVGTPVVVVPQDALQRDTYRGFMRVLDREDVGKLEDVFERADFTYPDEDHIVGMEIGEGTGELVELILRSSKRRRA